MTNQEFKDCEFRYTEDNKLHCKNKQGFDYHDTVIIVPRTYT